MAFTTFDNAPYLYRKSGGGGDKEIDKLVGGTIAWNQLTISNDNAVNITKYGITCAKAAGAVGEWTFSGTSEAVSSDSNFYASIKGVTVEANHVYLSRTKSSWFTMYCFGTVAGSITQLEYMVKATNRGTENFTFRPYRNLPVGTVINEVIRPQFYDLTLMFGSTIADYVYSLEQSSQGSGLAWLRSYGFFTEDYYDYNSGELKSVDNLVSHDMTGKNLIDTSTVTVSGITFTQDNDGRLSASPNNSDPRQWGYANSQYRVTLPKGSYTLVVEVDTTTSSTSSALNVISNDGRVLVNQRPFGTIGINTASFALTEETSIGVMVKQYSAVYRLMIVASGASTSYEPYALHSYPLGDVTLRGLPKLNGNALYYDGDTYESNGTVTRKYGIVDLGTLTWEKATAYSNTPYFRAHPTASIGTSAMCVCGKYATTTFSVLVSDSGDKTVTTASNGGWIYIKDSAYNDATAFKTAMSGVYLVYELASSTTETADTYTNPQWVDPNGTEKYTLSSNAFPMPVGHETTYNTDMGSKTVNTQVNLSMTEPQVRQVYAKEGDTARVLNIHLDQTEEDGTLRILRPDGTEVTADAVLVPDFYDGLMAEIPSDATSVVGKCYCDVEQNGVSSMPFTLNVKKNERQ